MQSMQLAILATGLLSLAVALLATAAMIRLAPRLGLVDAPGHRKIHRAPTPLGGGVAILLGTITPLLAALIFCHFTRPPGPPTYDAMSPATVAWQGPIPKFDPGTGPFGVSWDYYGGVRLQTPLALGLIAALLAMHALGLWDDQKALGPFLKLALQLTITAAFVTLSDVRLLTALDHLGAGRWPSVLLTVLWVGTITNAFNFLDNMDGLSAGVAAVCSAAFLLVALLIGQWFVAATLAALLGSLLGFLWFNFPPAKIFMGDSGSLLVGFLLGVLTVQTTFLPSGRSLAAGWYAVVAPLVVLALPLYDFLTVSLIRLSRGKSPFVGDTNHFSHRLVARGMTRRTAVLCLYLVTAATATAAVLLVYVDSAFAAMLIFAQTLLVLGVVALLEQPPPPGRDEG